MNGAFLDTATFAMIILDDPRLTPRARLTVEDASAVVLSAISFYEIGQKVRLGKWPEMAVAFDDLEGVAERSGIEIVPLAPQVAMKAAALDWSHRDPFDRLIAASAAVAKLPLLSPDRAFDSLDIERIWD